MRVKMIVEKANGKKWMNNEEKNKQKMSSAQRDDGWTMKDDKACKR